MAKPPVGINRKAGFRYSYEIQLDPRSQRHRNPHRNFGRHAALLRGPLHHNCQKLRTNLRFPKKGSPAGQRIFTFYLEPRRAAGFGLYIYREPGWLELTFSVVIALASFKGCRNGFGHLCFTHPHLDEDQKKWLRCRLLSFYDSAYYDDVLFSTTMQSGHHRRRRNTAKEPGAITKSLRPNFTSILSGRGRRRTARCRAGRCSRWSSG